MLIAYMRFMALTTNYFIVHILNEPEKTIFIAGAKLLEYVEQTPYRGIHSNYLLHVAHL